MSINEIVIAALESTGYAASFLKYTGTDAVYFVFSYSVIPEDYSDDEPSHARYLIFINLFAPSTFNTVQLCKDAKRALKEAGMSYPNQTDASDVDGQNIVFECEYVEGI